MNKDPDHPFSPKKAKRKEALRMPLLLLLHIVLAAGMGTLALLTDLAHPEKTKTPAQEP